MVAMIHIHSSNASMLKIKKTPTDILETMSTVIPVVNTSRWYKLKLWLGVYLITYKELLLTLKRITKLHGNELVIMRLNQERKETN